MTLGPATWGPFGWKFIHFITLGYPVNPNNEQKQNYKFFFLSLGNVLPCSVCSNNYKKNLLELPLTDDILNERDKLIKWAIDIHNMVNKETGKPEMSYEDAIKNMTNTTIITSPTNITPLPKNTNVSNNKTYCLCALILILLVLVIIAVVYKKK
jgi:hypothetical protein